MEGRNKIHGDFGDGFLGSESESEFDCLHLIHNMKLAGEFNLVNVGRDND